MTVGQCLTYAYDRDALHSHLQAWTDATRQNTTLRLPMTLPESAQPVALSEFAVVLSVIGPQRSRVIGEPGAQGRGVISVTVGAVTVRVHTSEALRSHLQAWTRAAALAAVLDPTEP